MGVVTGGGDGRGGVPGVGHGRGGRCGVQLPYGTQFEPCRRLALLGLEPGDEPGAPAGGAEEAQGAVGEEAVRGVVAYVAGARVPGETHVAAARAGDAEAGGHGGRTGLGGPDGEPAEPPGHRFAAPVARAEPDTDRPYGAGPHCEPFGRGLPGVDRVHRKTGVRRCRAGRGGFSRRDGQLDVHRTRVDPVRQLDNGVHSDRQPSRVHVQHRSRPRTTAARARC